MTTITRELIAAYLNGEVKTLTNSEQKELARIALASLDAGSDNHPAHGPVSLERLHQIREYLERNSQYQNGGNRAYILADMLKVIDELLEVRKAEPVAWTEKCEISNMQATGLYLRGFPDNSQGRDIALYTAPPAPVVREDLLSMAASAIEDLLEHTDPNTNYYSGVWADVPGKLRAAMLNGGKS